MFESDIELDIGIGDAPSLESGPINTLSISLYMGMKTKCTTV